ncbi:glutaredoxin family protein [Streptomyces sp. NBC_01497]|uniref:glutaredoxin family protein n=1 Tax=Streptomyces sp. NBC_01497 TaxID=2903885 RepID=UPI002E334D39|nr:glutaredoxin family protein [Streptomyces sp. NBC_01497]
MAGMTPLLRRTKKDGAATGRERGPRAGGADPAPPRCVTLISKPGCHLCDDARVVVERVCAQAGAVFEEKDITTDDALRDAYWEQIPVVLVDGEQHTFWRVDEERLLRALAP